MCVYTYLLMGKMNKLMFSLGSDEQDTHGYECSYVQPYSFHLELLLIFTGK